jgi:hypothetical protein
VTSSNWRYTGGHLRLIVNLCVLVICGVTASEEDTCVSKAHAINYSEITLSSFQLSSLLNTAETRHFSHGFLRYLHGSRLREHRGRISSRLVADVNHVYVKWA